MSKSRIVFFDWNGTFLDDEAATVQAFRAVLRGVGDERADLPTDELTALHSQIFEIPLSNMYDKINFSKAQKKLIYDEHFWSESYDAAVPTMKTHKGIDESLKILKDNNVNFGILSNHTAHDIKSKLKSLGFSDIPILANDHSGEAHVQGKLHRVEAYQEKYPETEILAIIGDTTEEVEIARIIETTSIALTNGWVRAERIKPSNPDYSINSAELPNVIKIVLSI